MIINKVKPNMIFVKNEPMEGLPFDDFWKSWDRLMNKEMYREANIFLHQRYNPIWNKGGGL